MTKHIKRFDSLESAKQATLYSPALTKITDRILVSVVGGKDTELIIKGDSLDNIVVEEKQLGVTVTIDDEEILLEPTLTYAEQGYDSLYGQDYYYIQYGIDEWEPCDPEEDRHEDKYPTDGDVFYTDPIIDECYCLLGDTLVTMADGSKKRIDEIELGDNVLSLNLDDGEQVFRKVIFTDKDVNKQALQWDEWEFSDGTIIKTTHRHEFYNVECGRFMYLDQWNIGEHTYKQDRTTPELVKHTVHDEVVNHYKITLEDSNNYFANELLTGDRNCKNNIKLV